VRWLVLLIAASAWAQSYSISPEIIRQGWTLQLHGEDAVRSARLMDRTVPMFPQGGGSFGLMPIPVAMKPGEYKLEFLDDHGSVLHTSLVTIEDAHYRKQNIVIAKAISELKPSPGESETVNEFRHEVSSVRYWKEPLQFPVPGCMISPFGVQRLHNGKPTGDYHGGIDQRGAAGTPIHAIAEGTVKIVRPFNLRGGTVAIDHGQGFESIYLHMSKFAAKEGDHVRQGDIIGYIGSTGRATGPHLHWAMYVSGEPVNPSQWVHFTACPTAETRKPKNR
jgi:murein DD-endopeptidase MepM/ murein hydrolase activator NlpD